jgi:putative membrane protein
MKTIVRSPLLAALFLVSALACGALRPAVGSPAPASDVTAGAARAASEPAPASVPLTDANIAAIVAAANNADILYADLALAKSQDKEIRAFANMVKKDHEAMNEAAVALVTKLKVTPVDNEVSFDLRDDAETIRLTFRDFEGFAFDSAYADNEVTYHKTVLVAIDDALIPSARNAELRALLLQVRPAVAAHLDHAEHLAATKTRR